MSDGTAPGLPVTRTRSNEASESRVIARVSGVARVECRAPGRPEALTGYDVNPVDHQMRR